MALPFLKHRPSAGVIVEQRSNTGSAVESPEDKDSSINACAADLIRAVHAKDEAGVASAIRAAFEIMESEPHEEYGNDFDSMNEQAAKQENE